MSARQTSAAYPLPTLALEGVGLSFTAEQADLEAAAAIIARAFALAAFTVILVTAAIAVVAAPVPPALRDLPGRADTRPAVAITLCPAAGHPFCRSN